MLDPLECVVPPKQLLDPELKLFEGGLGMVIVLVLILVLGLVLVSALVFVLALVLVFV